MIEKVLKRFCAQEICLLLERMESHPEEFFSDYSKWGWVFNAHGFTKIEAYLIKRKRKYVSHAYCRSGIVQTLLKENDPASNSVFSTTSRFTMEPLKTRTQELAEAHAKHQNKLLVSKHMLAAIKDAKQDMYEKFDKSLKEASDKK